MLSIFQSRHDRFQLVFIWYVLINILQNICSEKLAKFIEKFICDRTLFFGRVVGLKKEFMSGSFR